MTNTTNTAADSVTAILFEHEDGRYAINPNTTGDPAWHRLGPVDVSAIAAAPAQQVAPDGGSIVRLVEEKIAAMSPSEVAAFMTARAALAAPAQPVAHVSQETFNDDGTSDIIIPALPIGMALYAARAVYSRSMDLVRVFWQQHTQADALSMTMAELHNDVELVIRAARGAAQAAPVDATKLPSPARNQYKDTP